VGGSAWGEKGGRFDGACSVSAFMKLHGLGICRVLGGGGGWGGAGRIGGGSAMVECTYFVGMLF
jgi:hypothetical protein